MQGNSIDVDGSGTSDAREFWDGILGRRIAHIGNAPPARQYSNATISNIEALDEEKRVLQDEIDNFRHRCDNEDRALHNVLDALHEHRAREERAIESTIAAIHHHRNALIPISRLPPEILSRIFVFHAQIEPWKWLEAALTSTRVCRRWRQIGLDCPGLWSRIDCRSAAWMAVMMERSRSVPLSLVIIERDDIGPQRVTLIADNLHRFKSLDLHIPDANTHRFLELLGGPVPLLEYLSIVYVGHATFAFPSEFLGGSAPSLRHIKLITHSYVPWNSGLFANLVTLNVNAEGEPDGPLAPSIERLLSALARMPRLETLILCGCLPPPTSSTTITHVNLPNLDFLWTKGPLRNTTCLFRHFTTNASATMHVHIPRFRVSKEDVDEFLAIFPSRLCAAPSPAAQALKFDWQGPFGFGADVWTTQQPVEVMTDGNAKITLTLSWGSEGSPGISPLDLTWACFATFASPLLHSFHIVGDHIVGWDAEAWRKLARASPNLRRLILENDTVQCAELFEVLRPPDGQDLVPTDCCLPALSYLELLSPPNHPVPTPDGETAPLSEVLSDLLSMRAKVGCLAPELVFVSSSEEDFVGDWSKPFRDAVPGIIVRTVE
ncbi:hypothetical protein BD779DRAFT_457942 [Infundibulicybe gibba]|nr:hypothetical protein BD779DRAFT_457942 [Infundibulicybe gibba]